MKLMKHVVIIWELDLLLEVNKQNVENYHIWLHLDIVKRLEELNTIVVELWSIGIWNLFAIQGLRSEF